MKRIIHSFAILALGVPLLSSCGKKALSEAEKKVQQRLEQELSGEVAAPAQVSPAAESPAALALGPCAGV